MTILNQGGNYLKVDDVKEGDLITFKDEGTWVESTKYTYPDGNPKQDFVMKIDYKGQEYDIRINKFSRDELIPAYTKDTKNWIGKHAKISIEIYRSLNTKGMILSPIQEKVQGSKEEPTNEVQKVWDEEEQAFTPKG